MKRIRLNKRQDRKVFRKTSSVHPANSTAKSVMRGGIRK